eukprot:TRINITY_DN3361_c0_g1_i1.p1 TRINITY_DN3361_c0_g1~~TRINITY_DN3361_c0_g1_i1.p1  ORF type:complete len:471 (+),score=121.65 TRINITY_DN3361_c0_g1_i1:114-1526(+)
MKLHALPDHYKTKKILVAAKYVGVDIEVVPSVTENNQIGRIPVLETNDGCVFASVAIARYVARLNHGSGLYGHNVLEGGVIDSWMEFCTHELETPLLTWVMPVMGLLRDVPEATKLAKGDVKRALTVLNAHLLHNTYMVGHHITLADICICCALVDGFSLVLDEKTFQTPFAGLTRWFALCMVQPEFAGIIGEVKLCQQSAAPATIIAPKREAAPKKDGGSKKDKAAAAKSKAEEKNEHEDATGKSADAKNEAARKGEKKGKEKAGKAAAKASSDKQAADTSSEKTPEDPAEERQKLMKRVIKEGGKRGIEIEGAADMGGLQFFCTSVDEPAGDIELMDACVDAMNAEVDEGAEERKGGSGKIGKMIFSAGVDQLGIVAYVPKHLQGKIDASEWLQKVVALNGGEILQGATDLRATGFVKLDADKGLYPLKMKEPSIQEAINYLKSKGLFPDADSDDDDFVFGDDDFPSA